MSNKAAESGTFEASLEMELHADMLESGFKSLFHEIENGGWNYAKMEAVRIDNESHPNYIRITFKDEDTPPADTGKQMESTLAERMRHYASMQEDFKANGYLEWADEVEALEARIAELERTTPDPEPTLAARIRNLTDAKGWQGALIDHFVDEVSRRGNDIADEVAALEADNARLRSALKVWIADMPDWEIWSKHHQETDPGRSLTRFVVEEALDGRGPGAESEATND
jgi:hypothetical protein